MPAVKKEKVATTQQPQQEEQQVSEKNNNKLSQLAMISLQLIVLQQKPADKITTEEVNFLTTLDANIADSVTAELEGMKLIQKNDAGNFVATGYGVKWVLESLTYGKQFDRMVDELTLNAQFRLLFTIISKLDKKLENTVNYLGKDGNVSSMWKGLIEAANTIDTWCEAKPEEN